MQGFFISHQVKQYVCVKCAVDGILVLISDSSLLEIPDDDFMYPVGLLLDPHLTPLPDDDIFFVLHTKCKIH